MDAELDVLENQIAATLRGMIRIPPLYRGSIFGNPEFWNRCRRIEVKDWRKIILVDGYAGCCHSNSLKVYTDALEDGISLWLGYACAWNVWEHHCWCILGDRLIETTYVHAIYFGAELTPDEREQFGLKLREKKGSRDSLRVVTTINGDRVTLPCAPNWDYGSVHAKYESTIGRERDPQTGEVKPGLGR